MLDTEKKEWLVPNYLNIWDRLSQAPIFIDQTRCVKVRNRNASCLRCAHACTTGCISYANNELRLSPEKCIGCATCATVCPTDALYPQNPSDSDLHAQCVQASRRNAGVAVIACQKMLDQADGLYNSDKVVGVACLGRVDESLVVHLAALEAREVLLIEGPCSDCENAKGIAVAQQVCESANMLLEAWNAPLRVRFKNKLPASVRADENIGYDQGRRTFLLDTKDEAKQVATIVTGTMLEDAFDLHEEAPSRFVHVDKNNTLPHSVSPRRKLLQACLAALEERYGAPQDIMIDSRLWSEVIIDPDLCSGCRMCATFCPTGSNFKFSTKQGDIGVKHRVQQCVNCRLCRDVCPTEALTYSEEVFVHDVAHAVVERFVVPAPAASYNRADSMPQALRAHFKDDGKYVVDYGESKQV